MTSTNGIRKRTPRGAGQHTPGASRIRIHKEKTRTTFQVVGGR
jgi:hypothetical protein